jgi:hypothetical protein
MATDRNDQLSNYVRSLWGEPTVVMEFLQKVKKRLLNSSKTRLGIYVVRRISKKKELYKLHYPNNLTDIDRLLLPGDVLLIDGDYGISDWIKVFSSHTWSHCALYTGAQPVSCSTGSMIGLDTNLNLVEAIIGHGIILSSIEKYEHCNLRVCRPKNLTRRQRQRVVHFALSKVGLPYDERNIFRFMGLPFNQGVKPTEDISDTERGGYTCSGLIASAFSQVSLEILHYYDVEAKRIVPYHPSQIQPKDFDLSPNFEIIKIYPSTYKKPTGMFRSLFLKHKSA